MLQELLQNPQIKELINNLLNNNQINDSNKNNNIISKEKKVIPKEKQVINDEDRCKKVKIIFDKVKEIFNKGDKNEQKQNIFNPFENDINKILDNFEINKSTKISTFPNNDIILYNHSQFVNTKVSDDFFDKLNLFFLETTILDRDQFNTINNILKGINLIGQMPIFQLEKIKDRNNDNITYPKYIIGKKELEEKRIIKSECKNCINNKKKLKQKRITKLDEKLEQLKQKKINKSDEKLEQLKQKRITKLEEKLKKIKQIKELDKKLEELNKKEIKENMQENK